MMTALFLRQTHHGLDKPGDCPQYHNVLPIWQKDCNTKSKNYKYSEKPDTLVCSTGYRIIIYKTITSL